MSSKKALQYFFKSIYILGIIPATFCEKQNKLIVTVKYEKYVLRMTVIVMVVVESFLITFCLLSFSDKLKMFVLNKTTSSLIFILIFECAVIQTVLSITFYVFRYKNIEIFQRILTYGANIMSKDHSKRILKRILTQCLLNTILTALYIGNIVLMWLINPYIEWELYMCNTVILVTFFLYGTIYLTCFTCLLIVVVEWLNIINEKLIKSKTTLELSRLLTIRNDLLNSCVKKIKLVYSLPIILQSGYALTSLSSFFFQTTIAFELLNENIIESLYIFILSSLHILPQVVIYITALSSNDIDKEVNFN